MKRRLYWERQRDVKWYKNMKQIKCLLCSYFRRECQQKAVESFVVLEELPRRLFLSWVTWSVWSKGIFWFSCLTISGERWEAAGCLTASWRSLIQSLQVVVVWMILYLLPEQSSAVPRLCGCKGCCKRDRWWWVGFYVCPYSLLVRGYAALVPHCLHRTRLLTSERSLFSLCRRRWR